MVRKTYATRSKTSNQVKPKSNNSNSSWSEASNSPSPNKPLSQDEKQAETVRAALNVMRLSPRDIERVRATSKTIRKAVPPPEYPEGYKNKENMKYFLRTLERKNMTDATDSVKKMISKVGPSAASTVFLKNPDLFDFSKPAHRNTVGVAVETLRRTEKDAVDEYLETLANKGHKEQGNDRYYLNQIGMTPYVLRGIRRFRILPGWTTTEH